MEKSKSSDAIRKNVISELKHFRETADLALSSFKLKLEGEIEQMIELFSNKKIGISDEELCENKKIVDEITADLKRLKIKANKGRKKDIKKIESVIRKLREKTDLIV